MGRPAIRCPSSLHDFPPLYSQICGIEASFSRLLLGPGRARRIDAGATGANWGCWWPLLRTSSIIHDAAGYQIFCNKQFRVWIGSNALFDSRVSRHYDFWMAKILAKSTSIPWLMIIQNSFMNLETSTNPFMNQVRTTKRIVNWFILFIAETYMILKNDLGSNTPFTALKSVYWRIQSIDSFYSLRRPTWCWRLIWDRINHSLLYTKRSLYAIFSMFSIVSRVSVVIECIRLCE